MPSQRSTTDDRSAPGARCRSYSRRPFPSRRCRSTPGWQSAETSIQNFLAFADYDGDGLIDLDLPGLLGADPNRKDLFVEVDAMLGRAPTVILFGLVSFWALREFITMTPPRRGDRRIIP